MTKERLLQIEGVGEATAEKILQAIAKGENLTEKFGAKIAKAVTSLRQNNWTKITDMRVVNLIKRQIKALDSDGSDLKQLLTTRTKVQKGAAKGNVKLGNTSLFVSTEKGRKEDVYISAVYEKDDKGKWVEADFYILSYLNKDTGFLNAGVLPHSK